MISSSESVLHVLGAISLVTILLPGLVRNIRLTMYELRKGIDEENRHKDDTTKTS